MKIIINTTLNPTDVLSASVIKEDTSCELNTIELSDLIAVLEFKLDHQKTVDAIASIEDGKLYYFSGFYYLARRINGLVFFKHADKNGLTHGESFGASRISVHQLKLAKKQPLLVEA